jgi:hypothetical protein
MEDPPKPILVVTPINIDKICPKKMIKEMKIKNIDLTISNILTNFRILHISWGRETF